MKTEAEPGVMPPWAKEHQKPPETRKGTGGCCPEPLEDRAPANTLTFVLLVFRTVRIHFLG